MRVLLVVTTDVGDNGEPVWDEFESDELEFLVEPSGTLVMFRAPGDLWAAYAPGAWKMVREPRSQE